MSTEDIIIMSILLAILAFGAGCFLYVLAYWFFTGTNPGDYTRNSDE